MIRRVANGVRFLLRSYRQYRNEDTILIYQMGKVGSTALARSLGDRAIQIHNFYPANRPFYRKPIYGSSLCKIPLHWAFYRVIRRAIRRRRALKIITLVRDPVSRNISMYFQDLPYFLSYYMSEVRRSSDSREEGLDVLVECFRDSFNHHYPLDWFDKEFRRFTGIDVYEHVFDSAAGWSKIDAGRISVLVVQTERLRDCWHIVEEFCGCRLEMRQGNRGERKWYGKLYSEFLDKYVFSTQELDEIYSSKFARFFFSEDMRAQLRRRWQSPDGQEREKRANVS